MNAEVSEKIISINVPTKIITSRYFLDNNIKQRTKKNVVIILIPGNPGIIDYYKEFIIYLYNKTSNKYHICAIGHAGHDATCNRHVPEKYLSLNGQILHKIEIIEQIVPEAFSIIFIGHSIGAYICLHLLDHFSTKKQIKKTYMIFPAIERIAHTPNGKKFYYLLKYGTWLIDLIRFSLSLVPFNFKKKFLYFLLQKYGDNCVHATLQFTDYKVNQRCSSLLRDELLSVTNLNVALLNRFYKNILLYYGVQDAWCPVNYYENLKSTMPHANAILCSEGLPHHFVLGNNEKMAEIIYQFLKVDLC